MSEDRANEWGRERTRFGQGFARGEYPGQSQYPSSAFGAAGRSWGFAWEDVKARWGSIFDPTEQMSADDFKEMVGARDLTWEPGTTKQRTQRLMAEHDHEQYLQNYESRPIAEFLGMMPPYMLDPVSAATLPVGGTSFARAAGAASFRQFLGQSSVGGAKVGAAATPVEAAVQSQTYGELRGDMLAATALGSVAAAPILSAPGYALRGLSSSRTATEVASAIDSPVDAHNLARTIDAEGDIAPPPFAQLEIDSLVPVARVNEIFAGYEGGPRRWFSDFAAGSQRALEYARTRGVDPDAPALRRLARQQAEFTVRRTPTSAEQRFTDLEDMVSALEGRAVPEQTQRLGQRGLLRQVRDVQEAEAVPGFQRPAEMVRAAREGERIRTEAAEFETRPEFAELASALRKPGFQRTASERLAHREFLERGAEGLQTQRINRLRQEYDGLNQRIADLDADLASRRGRKPKRLVDELAELNAQRSQLAQELDDLGNQLGRVDDKVPMEDLMAAIDQAQLESAFVRPPLQQRQPGEGQAALNLEDARLNEIEAWARSVGVETDSPRALIRSVERSLGECGL